MESVIPAFRREDIKPPKREEDNDSFPSSLSFPGPSEKLKGGLIINSNIFVNTKMYG